MKEEAETEAAQVDANGNSVASRSNVQPSNEAFWSEKPKQGSNVNIFAHCGIIAAKSAFFAKIFREKMPKKVKKEDHLVIDFGG